jgi:hypothetical protein
MAVKARPTKKAAKAFATRPGKKLTLQQLERLEADGANRMHNRFIIDPKSKVAWAPSWVKKVKVAKKK